ncbi:MAG: 50S ribosomal protein L25 [Patescibacteria group bacterium]|jgi:large subunit ribosomal protein L25
MAKREKLTAQKRELTGHKVKKLRREGILPANLFGKKIKSQSLQVNLKEFLKVFEKTGETGLIDLVIDDKETRSVLVGNVQIEPVSDQLLHVDFHQVNLEEKVTVAVPIHLVGEAPAVVQDEGVLVQPLAEVEVEALPTDLPDHLEADISSLDKIDAAVRVADLKVPKGVVVKTVQEEVVAIINPKAKEEEVAPAAEEAAVAEGEKGAEEAPASAEGEEKAAGGQKVAEENKEG